MRRRSAAALATTWVLIATSAVAAKPQAKSEGSLVFVIGDNDVLHASAESVPVSPSVGIGDRDGYRLFFDGYGAPDTSRESRVAIALRGSAPGYLPGLETHAALEVSVDWQRLMNAGSSTTPVFRDEGSFIELCVRLGGNGATGATLFPVDTNALRLGWLDDLAWGGTRSSREESIFPGAEGNVPGGQLYFAFSRVRAFAGLKTASLNEITPGGVRQPETNWGFLGGLAAEFGSWLRAEIEGGYFEQGRLEQPGVEGRLAYSAGASGRLILRSGRELPSVPEFFSGLPSRDASAEPFSAPRSATRRGFALAFETSVLGQRLQDFEAPETTEHQLARALGLYGSADIDAFEARLGLFYREPSFVLRNAPSFPRFATLPEAFVQTPELSASLGATLRPPQSLLIPSIDLGLRWPATLSTRAAPDQFGQRSSHTIVLHGPQRIAPLEPGAGAVAVLHGRVSLLFVASSQVSLLAWLSYRRDNNATRMALDSEGLARARRFVAPDFAGGGLAVRAGF